MPILEELLEAPILKNKELNHDTASFLKNYVPPLLLNQIEASLSHEFGRHIRKTDWSEYADPFVEAEHEQAARLIGYTMATMKNACASIGTQHPIETVARKNDAWVKMECDRLLEELCTGNTDRWESPSKLTGKTKLGETQQKALTPSIVLVANNPYLHPAVKRRILASIKDIIVKTITS